MKGQLAEKDKMIKELKCEGGEYRLKIEKLEGELNHESHENRCVKLPLICELKQQLAQSQHSLFLERKRWRKELKDAKTEIETRRLLRKTELVEDNKKIKELERRLLGNVLVSNENTRLKKKMKCYERVIGQQLVEYRRKEGGWLGAIDPKKLTDIYKTKQEAIASWLKAAAEATKNGN